MKTNIVNFSNLTINSSPFPHFISHFCLNKKIGKYLLNWFSKAKWEYRGIDGFYETYDMNIKTAILPSELEILRESGFIRTIRTVMEQWTGLEFEDHLDIHAQKLVPGYRIGIHNDFGPARQTHRLLFQINDGWDFNKGGLLMLFDSDMPTEHSLNSRYYLPQHLSAMAFEISPQSHHAVSEIFESIRYTLVYSFYCVEGYSRLGFEYGLEPFMQELKP